VHQEILDNPAAGQHSFSFSPDANGHAGSGKICLVTVRGDDFVVTRKIMLR
jgi:hypothetical protein